MDILEEPDRIITAYLDCSVKITSEAFFISALATPWCRPHFDMRILGNFGSHAGQMTDMQFVSPSLLLRFPLSHYLFH